MATASAMSVKTFLETAVCLPPEASIMLRGDHGIGKSQVVRQLARRRQAMLNLSEFEVIDRRLSQMSEGDMVGLPSTDGEVTRFNPPDWYKRACLKPCLLFLDELNRATHEVMQAAFQIVLDRELNGWKLHPQTYVASAVNVSSNYTVNEIDPALLDRFWVIDLRPTVEDWTIWARDPNAGDIIPEIVDHIAHEEKWLDPPKNADLGSKHTSRRSWERLSTALKFAKLDQELNDPKVYPISLGFLGVEATIAFTDFIKTVDNRVTGKEVIETYSKVRAKIKRLSVERLNPVIEKVTEYLTKDIKKLSDKQGKNLKEFMHDLPDELRISCWTKLAVQGVDRLELARSIHKWCAEEVLSTFGVPIGDAGVGVIPNVPGVFKGAQK